MSHQQPPNVVYSAPAPEVLEAFARKVCRKLGTDFTTHEVMEGFSTFVKVVADINVKHRNQSNSRGHVDKHE